jgi:hypothetical protein
VENNLEGKDNAHLSPENAQVLTISASKDKSQEKENIDKKPAETETV